MCHPTQSPYKLIPLTTDWSRRKIPPTSNHCVSVTPELFIVVIDKTVYIVPLCVQTQPCSRFGVCPGCLIS